MLRAVIYCRCSTEEESQQEALKKQVIEARESVAANGWQLVDEYIELKSGTTCEKRIEYQRLFNDLQNEKFDIVQIKSQDRLMRNTKDWYLFIDRLVTNGKKLYMYMERKFYTPDDALITGIKAILAEEYSKELSKKINNAHRNRQRRGESFIIPPGTYGYRKLPDKSIAVVEEEAKIIRLMFELCQTMGCGRIAYVLEREGYCDRRGLFFKEESIRRIIRNPIRCGTVIQNQRHFDFQLKQALKMPEEEWIVHKKAVPAIVSEDLWEKANRAMDRRAGIFHAAGYDRDIKGGQFELSGKLHCGLCGGNYYRTSRRRPQNNDKIIEWKCRNYLRYGRKRCDNIHLEEQKLLSLLEGVCKAYSENYGIDYQEIMDRTITVLKAVLVKKEPLEKSQEVKRTIRRQKLLSEKLMDKLLDGVISDDDYKRRKAGFDEKLQELEEELKNCQQSEDIYDEAETRIHKIEERLKEDTVHKAALLEMLDNVESIEVFENKLELQFENAYVLEIPLGDEFAYASRKRAERNRIIAYMRERPHITAKEIAKIEQISLTTANYRIKKLRQQGKVYFDGRGGHGKWIVCESGEEK